MSSPWYYTRAGEQMGPVEWSELHALALGSELAPGDHVWTDGFSEWKTASSMPDLFTRDAPPTPAPSTPAAPVPQAASPQAMQVGAAVAVAGVPGVIGLDYSGMGSQQFEYAGFWMRFGASFIDGLIILAIGIALTTAFTSYIGADAVRANGPTVRMFANVVFLTVGWMYFAMLESSAQQSTLGKRLLGLKVTDLAGNPISFGRATGRHFGKIVSQLILLIGYLFMLFTPNSQCLHDLMAGCVVVKAKWD
jgi:uncharacterized RDD family membrane protein YckC